MSQRPVVTVVIPLYNKGKDVERSLRSVLAQNISEFEIIVVNDGSTDNGPDIVRGIGDARIRIIDQENTGVSAARNRAVEEARSDLIAFLDADDEWAPDFLATILHLEKKFPECAVFATGYWYRTVNGKMRKPIFRSLPSGEWEGALENYFEIAARSDPPLWTSAVVVRKEALQAVGGFPVGVTSGEDLLTWARLAVQYKVAYSAKRLSQYFYNGSLLPSRLPDRNDIVGNGLRELVIKTKGSRKDALRCYIGLWHKMRAVQYLRQEDPLSSQQEITKALEYSPNNKKYIFYKYLSHVPSPVLSVYWSILGAYRKRRR